MPTVPAYDNFQVAPNPAPGARQSSVATQSIFSSALAPPIAPPVSGPGAEGLAAIGKGLFSSGDEAVKIVANMQDRENADMLFRAETALKDDLVKYHTQASQRLGANAKGVTADTEKWFGEAATKHAQGLTSEAQRRLFGQEAQKLRLQTIESVSKHEAMQARVALEDSTNASIVGSINLAAANANDWTVAEAQKKDIRTRIEVLAQVNGKGPEWRDQKIGESLTTLHTQVIQQLVKDSPVAAKAYFDKYVGEIDGAKRAELGEFAKKATAVALGDGAADNIWKELGPKSRADAVTLDTMETKLREQLKGNDDAIEKGIKGLRERATAFKDQRKEESNALEAGVNGLILKGVSTAALRQSPEFIKLSAQDPEAARKIDTFMENKDYMRVARSAAEEQRKDAAESRAQRRLHNDTLDTTLRMSDPDVLVRMTRDQVINLLPILGRESTTQLLSRWDSLTKSHDKLVEARIDKQDFERIALTAGFRPNEKNKTEEEKDRLVRLQSGVETAIDIEQRAKKRALTREEKAAVMQREIDNAVMVQRFILPNKATPASALSPDEVKGAYVEVGPEKQRVKLVDIPPSFRLETTTQRRAAGLPTTERQLGELWLRKQGKFKDVR